MKLKVCGLKYKTNTKSVFSEIQADYTGFIFYPVSERYAGKIINKIASMQTNKTEKVAVLVNCPLNYAYNYCEKGHIKTVQLHADESPAYCEKIKKFGYSIIKAFNIHNDFDFKRLNDYKNVCDYFLFDASGKNKGGNGIKFNWKLLDKYKGEKKYFLSGGIDLKDAGTIKEIKDKRLYGIDINSRFEISPGKKDINKILKFKTRLYEK